MTDTVTTPPPTAAKARRKPADRQPSKAEQARDAEIALELFKASLPPLKDAEHLRIRERNGVLNLGFKMEQITGDEGLEFETSDPRTMELLDLLAEFDEWAEEHLALDGAAYTEWATTGDVYSKLGDLLAMYSSAVGESTGSSS